MRNPDWPRIHASEGAPSWPGELKAGKKLRLGVVGHRPDKLEGAPELSARLGELLPDLQAAAAALGHAMELWTSTAAGTDLLAVRAAASTLIAIHLVIAGKLPVARAEVAAEGPAWPEHFDAAINLAASVEEVDGAGDRRYAMVAGRILARSDLLLAVWDGAPGRGEGGTAKSVETALSRGLPVLWLDSRKSGGMRLMSSGQVKDPVGPWLGSLFADRSVPIEAFQGNGGRSNPREAA
jgi:hypothetical protein